MDTTNVFSEIYSNMSDILAHPERYTDKVTGFSAGGHGAKAYGDNVTAAELVGCWQHEEYNIGCPICESAANITFWAGNCASGGYWQIRAYCPQCGKEINYHRSSYPFADIKTHWTKMKEILDEVRENIKNNNMKRMNAIDYVPLNDAFEKNGWKEYRQFMAGTRWEKGDDTVTSYLGKYKLNGQLVGKEYLCRMLDIDTSLRIYQVCAAVAPQSIHSAYGKAFNEGVIWADSTQASEEYDQVVFEHLDFSAILETFEKEGWNHYRGLAYDRWVKGDDRAKCVKGKFRLNDQPVSKEELCRLLHIDPRVVRVSKAIAPYPLSGKYGQAFLDGVRWADAHPANQQ
jgi:hypothetical protein